MTLSQRAIYDERYTAGDYDRRSAVRVLTAEREALNRAVRRALTSNRAAPKISLFDFGYGTGRVINEWLESDARQLLAGCPELKIVAYDVSSAGLQKAQQALCLAGYVPAGAFTWAPAAGTGYLAGSVRKEMPGLSVTVVFVHGCEKDPPDVMQKLALQANDDDRYLLTTSWYSGLGHVPGKNLRQEYFRQLAELASPAGEIVLAVSSTGDLAEPRGSVSGFPVEMPGDLIYKTELGQSNFYHVFGTDLNNHMRAITSRGQHWWVEGIRCPDEEFTSREAEQANYQRVLTANENKRDRTWSAADYQEFHTVAAFRSSAQRSPRH